MTVDNEDIELLGDRQSHLHLPDNLITISSKFTWTKSSSNTDSKTKTQLIIRINMYCVQTEPEDESFTSRTTTRGPLRRKMPDKGKLKATLPDVETPEDNNR